LKKLEQADARIHSVVDQVLDGMILIDEKGLISSMNPAARRMFGFDGNHMTDHRFASLIPKYFESENSDGPIACNWSNLLKRTGGITLAQAKNRTQAPFPVELSLTKWQWRRRNSTSRWSATSPSENDSRKSSRRRKTAWP
jgi:PAS domain-containing protein